MKLYISLFFLIILTNACDKSNIIEMNFSEENNLKGLVKEYSESQFFNTDTTFEKYDCMDTYKLDLKGNLIEKRHYGGGDKLVLIDSIKINGENKIHTTHNWNNLLLTNIITKSKIRGNSIQKKDFFNGKLWEISKFIYDSKNNLVELDVFDPNNIIKSKETYKYDKYKNLTEKYHYDITRSLTKPYIKVVYKFDSFGNVTNENHISLRSDYKIGDPKYVWKYTYDKQGNWTRKFDYASNHKYPYMREERKFIYR